MSPVVRADVCVIGAGIVGLHNALQYARRGFSVVIVDELTERGMNAYKVGESLLIFSNAFLRTIGDLDKELNASFEKRGVWFAYGMEGKKEFDADVTEWGFQHAIPERWAEAIEDKKFKKTMFGDCQIVRPEIEAVLRERLKQYENITLIDRGLVRDVELGSTLGAGADHLVTWKSKDSSAEGTVRARWLVDCSGRARLLVKRFGHDVPLNDDFRTSAVWGQFSGCTDEFFDERWNFEFPDGDVVRRDLDTVHLWGDGYWIWLIRLKDDRISVGVSLHRARVAVSRNLREAFWQIIRRYPTLDWLQEQNALDFTGYRDVQYISDTYVSPERYIVVGDASSIIDAYYSQGLSLSMTTSWHGANIAERDLRDGVLDTAYIRHVNNAVLADWRIMRSVVKSKYTRAIADSRFFILDHWIDYLVFGSATVTRWRIARWLSKTDGYPSRETRDLTALRQHLGRQLYLSQSPPFNLINPARFAGIIERLHRNLERRAIWRLEHGVSLRATVGAMRADAPFPAMWRLPFLRFRRKADLTMKAIHEPSWYTLKVSSKPPWVTKIVGLFLIAATIGVVGYDIADTTARRALYRVRGGGRGRVRGTGDVAQEATGAESRLARTP
jgi:2-polyprenyl-6-methoxyphenol hydroxylase-like FAD-dependent oxidoreductase